MVTVRDPSECFVVKPDQLNALNYLHDDCPKPEEVEWINRATDKCLRQSSVDQLLRTLYHDNLSDSVARLKDNSGLRAIFASAKDRNGFVGGFREAVKEERAIRNHAVTAIFRSREQADRAVADLSRAGMPQDAFCVLSKASLFIGQSLVWPDGHGRMEVTGATAGGGIAGALFGIVVFAIPGVGPIAATGAAAASAFGSVAALSGVIGATGAALSKVLSDFDVDGMASNYLEQEIRKGSVFVTVDTRICPRERSEIVSKLLELGGKIPKR